MTAVSPRPRSDAIPPIDARRGHERWPAPRSAGSSRCVDDLRADDWQRPTDCTGWTVRDMLGHLLGMMKLQADPEERRRQITAAAELARRSGELRLTEMTALQVREHADLTTDELRRALHEAAPRGLAARRALPAGLRAAPYDPNCPARACGPSATCSTSSTPRPLVAPRGHLPGHRPGPVPDRRARRAHRGERRGRLGATPREAVRPRADRTGWCHLHRGRRRHAPCRWTRSSSAGRCRAGRPGPASSPPRSSSDPDLARSTEQERWNDGRAVACCERVESADGVPEKPS